MRANGAATNSAATSTISTPTANRFWLWLSGEVVSRNGWTSCASLIGFTLFSSTRASAGGLPVCAPDLPVPLDDLRGVRDLGIVGVRNRGDALRRPGLHQPGPPPLVRAVGQRDRAAGARGTSVVLRVA